MHARRRALLVGLGAALLAAATAEGALRLLGFGEDPGAFYFERLGERILEPGMYAPHARRFFALQPGYRHSPGHAGPNALGAWPFRGPPLEPAPEGAWRIALFGDSCVFGLPLPANAALPAALDDELARALGDGRALVSNLGVPGYTTVQIGALVEEVMERDAPDEAVLYPAAWNDQAPSLGRNDLELRADASGFPGLLRRSALVQALRPGRAPAEPEDSLPPAERGPRVPAEAVEGEVRAAIRACRAAGAGVTVIVPPHPERFRATHPRMFADAEAVRRAAEAEGADIVDLQSVLGVSGQEDRFFADLVHPAPEGHRALAQAVARVLLLRDGAGAARGGGGLRIAACRPRAVPELGDVELVLELDGWSAGEPLPAVTVGGAPLLAARADGAHGVRGTVPRLAAGAARIAAQSPAGLAAAGLEVLAPRLEVLPGDPPRVRVVSRPGDGARVFAATAETAQAKWSARGAQRLDGAALLPVELSLVLGADGAGEVDLPALAGPGPFYLQALIAPAGEPADSDFALWSPVATWP